MTKLNDFLDYKGEIVVTLKGQEIIHEKVYKRDIDNQKDENDSVLKKIKNFFKNLF